jgi:predicted DCC family thiol-disulfide oxidoreductase YuxK
MDSGHHAVVLFDGVCNFCDNTVQFVLRRDKAGYFRFAALQSEAGQALLKDHELPTEHFDTFILLENGKIYKRSSAALRLVRKLSGGWPLLYGFILIPRFIRDFFYSIIARNRYRWFGKKDACMIPSPEVRSRFL